jgi:hypothetical protein
MEYRVNPLIYAANDQFKNTIRFALELTEDIDMGALQYATEQVKKRYPYFSVKLRSKEEGYVLVENEKPFIIAADGAPRALGSAESNEHLLAFAIKENRIFIDVSHFIADGNGIAPVVKTLLYYYVEKRYGADEIDTDGIRLVTDPVLEDEYLYPFPEAPIPVEDELKIAPKEYVPFQFDDAFFDDAGPYAYHLQVKQQELLKYLRSKDGSPVSFTCVMLFKALTTLYPDTDKDIVFQIPHEYRAALGRPLSHDSLARVIYARLTGKNQSMDLESLITAIRGQVILGIEPSADVAAINGMVQLGAYMQTLPLEAKKQVMLGAVSGSLNKHTFGVSYTGQVSWGGMEKYLRDVYPYAGENHFSGVIGIEIFSVGENFSICMMQPGKNPAFVNAVIKAFDDCGVKCSLASEERYVLADFMIP